MTLPLENLTVIEASEGVVRAMRGSVVVCWPRSAPTSSRSNARPRATGLAWPNPDCPAVRESEASALHLHLNMGKRSVLLDWHTERGSESLKRLIQNADVLLEDWDTAALDRIGLTDGVEALNPYLIDLSLTPVRNERPLRELVRYPARQPRPRRLPLPVRRRRP